MIYIQFTGKGWLTYAFVAATIALGIVVGTTVFAGQRYVGAGVAAAIIAVVGGPMQWSVGRWLNGSARPEHTTYGVPMEALASFYPALGLLLLAFVIGSATNAVWGWLVGVGAALFTWLLIKTIRGRARGVGGRL